MGAEEAPVGSGLWPWGGFQGSTPSPAGSPRGMGEAVEVQLASFSPDALGGTTFGYQGREKGALFGKQLLGCGVPGKGLSQAGGGPQAAGGASPFSLSLPPWQ